MASYPNIQLTSTATLVLSPAHNGLVIVSTLGSSVNLQVPSNLPAGFLCYAVQAGTSTIGVTAGSGATANNEASATGTSGQYASIRLIAYTDGNVVFSGDAS